jgi:ubiquinone/menaquinone biosynthesis C-methylase UbiE
VGYAHAPNIFLKGEVTGLDLHLPEKKPDNYSRIIRGDSQNLSEYFNSEAFDTIIAGELIEHLPNYCAFLDECAKVLRKGGGIDYKHSQPIFVVYNIRKYNISARKNQ